MLDPDTLLVTCVHMQAMLASSRGEVLATSTSERSAEDEVDPDDDLQSGSRIRPGERITYLYRYTRCSDTSRAIS